VLLISFIGSKPATRGCIKRRWLRSNTPLISAQAAINVNVSQHQITVESRFATGLRSRIFGCKSNRRKTSTI